MPQTKMNGCALFTGLELIAVSFGGFLPGCSNRVATSDVEIYDTLQANQAKTVRLDERVVKNRALSEVIEGISTAVGRTPNLSYQISDVLVFPTNGYPVAARVTVQGRLLFLCRGRDDHWHVFRVASSVVDAP